MARVYIRKDIEIRNRAIYGLYLKGVARKQIPLFIQWIPIMTYEAVKKVIQQEDRRSAPRGTADRRKTR